MKYFYPAIVFTLFVFVLSACAGGQPNDKVTIIDPDEKLVIYTTVYPLKYFTEVIGGEFVQVDSIYPTGADTHTFEPTQQDMMKIADADVLFYIGLGLEGFVEKTKDTLKKEHVTLVSTSRNIPAKELHTHKIEKELEIEEEDHTHGDLDPHIWLDPIFSIDLAQVIKEELIAKMPEQEQYFSDQFTMIANQLHALDEKFSTSLQGAKHNKLLVSHAAFGYWEKRYNVEQISISGLSTTNEPTQKNLESIIEKAHKYHLKHILFEQNGGSRLAKIVQNELAIEPLTIHNLGVLTEKDYEDNPTYFTLMENNLDVLKIALEIE